MLQTLRRNLFFEFSMEHIEEESKNTGTSIENTVKNSPEKDNHKEKNHCCDCGNCDDCLEVCCANGCDNNADGLCDCCDCNGNGVCDCSECCNGCDCGDCFCD